MKKPTAVMDRVFIRLEQETASPGGLILTAAPGERTIGIVESVGPLVTCVRPGERVLFHAFDELPTYDESVVVVRQNSILGIFKGDNK